MLLYIIIGLLVLLLIVDLVLIFKIKSTNESDIIQRLGKIETTLVKEIGDFKTDFSRTLTTDFTLQSERIDKRLQYINDKVNERLDVNFEKTNKTFSNVLERLAKIDEAQKKIDSLSSDIVSLQNVLTDKKSRGIFGEVNLNHILSSIFGEKNDKIYKLQYTLPNGYIVDSILFGPSPLGDIGIDSKFPLENYRKLTEKGLTEEEKIRREKLFETDVKKHIDAIALKYIIPGVTSNQAIMFLPAEAIFAEINAYHPSLIDYAARKNVWLSSPTTLMSLLTVVQAVLMGMERDKYTSIIHEELNNLGNEFSKYRERWDKLSRSIDSVSKDVKDINITTEKITKRFSSISNVEIETDTKQIEE
ncbi:MAG: DNA recombination protein RmuC [Bacilli bacterium]